MYFTLVRTDPFRLIPFLSSCRHKREGKKTFLSCLYGAPPFILSLHINCPLLPSPSDTHPTQQQTGKDKTRHEKQAQRDQLRYAKFSQRNGRPQRRKKKTRRAGGSLHPNGSDRVVHPHLAVAGQPMGSSQDPANMMASFSVAIKPGRIGHAAPPAPEFLSKKNSHF